MKRLSFEEFCNEVDGDAINLNRNINRYYMKVLEQSFRANDEYIGRLEKQNEVLLEQLKEFKVFGTDECPECETAPIGGTYNRTTLFYRPREHDSHDKIKEMRNGLS